jgi:hypothetical protein
MYPAANSKTREVFRIADSRDATNDKITSIVQSKNNGFAPLPDAVIRSARHISRSAQLANWLTDVFPGRSGEALVTLERGSDYYEIMIEVKGSFTVVHEVNNERVARKTEKSIESTLKAISNDDFVKCVTYDSFAQPNGISVNSASLPWRLEIQVKNEAVESQSVTKIALQKSTELFVRMQENVTAINLHSQYCFG